MTKLFNCKLNIIEKKCFESIRLVKDDCAKRNILYSTVTIDLCNDKVSKVLVDELTSYLEDIVKSKCSLSYFKRLKKPIEIWCEKLEAEIKAKEFAEFDSVDRFKINFLVLNELIDYYKDIREIQIHNTKLEHFIDFLKIVAGGLVGGVIGFGLAKLINDPSIFVVVGK